MAYTNPNIATSAATFANLQVGGLSNLLERLITVNGAGTIAPTVAPTIASTGSSGTLTAATYYAVVTETNGIGETTASPVSTGQVISSTLGILVTFTTLKTGNTARNTYLGTSATGPWLLAASGTTASTVTINSLPTNSYAVQPPAINTTGFTWVDANGNTANFALQAIRSAKVGKLQDTYNEVATTLDRWLRGDPMSSMAIKMKIAHAQTAFLTLAQACADAGTLVDANAGTLKPGTSGGVGTVPTTVRTWP